MRKKKGNCLWHLPFIFVLDCARVLMAGYTHLLAPVVAEDGDRYCLELVFDTQEQLYLKDTERQHLYILVLGGSVEAGDLGFLTALRGYFMSKAPLTANVNECTAPRIVHMKVCRLAPGLVLHPSTYFTKICIEFEYVSMTLDGKPRKLHQELVFHRFDPTAMTSLMHF